MDYIYFQYIIPTLNNLAIGEATTQFLIGLLKGVGGVLAAVGGTYLIVWVGAKDIIKGLSGENKDIKKILIGLATMVAGGIIVAIGVAGLLSIGTTLGADFGIQV